MRQTEADLGRCAGNFPSVEPPSVKSPVRRPEQKHLLFIWRDGGEFPRVCVAPKGKLPDGPPSQSVSGKAPLFRS